MPFTELKFQHYCAIRDFMDEIELDPEDAMTPMEGEALSIVKQIIANIEKRRQQVTKIVKPHQHRYQRKLK